jgi:hypothetical protein
MKSIVVIALISIMACKGKNDGRAASGSGAVAAGSGSAVTGSGFGSGPGGSGASAEPSGSGRGSGSGGGDIPKECDDWKAMVDKLMGCDKMPEPQRKIMKDAYDQASALWPTMPAASKAQLATSCKAGADAIMSSAKATCGW